MTRLTRLVQERGYIYFDWNVDSGDGMYARTSGRVYKNIISGIRNKECSIVLQHDTKDYSVASVERVIVWGLRNGYCFLSLDESVPVIHHELRN